MPGVPDSPKLVRTRRNLPHWTLEGSIYFITFRVHKGTLSDEERNIALAHIVAGDQRFYILLAAVIMPNHVHLLIKPMPDYSLPRIMKGIKGVSSRKINIHRQTRGAVWQDESWDRIVRDAHEFEEKLNYMADNPVKEGLVSRIEDYPFWYCNKELI